MVGKVISASSFSGTVGYVMKEESRILEAEGIMPPEVKDMVQDFKDQTLLNPRLKNTVGHISLSFSPKDAPRMTDALMTRIAKEYMQKMGITDTQYLLVRHLDQPHPHCHLVYNRVGNNGPLSDRNIKIQKRQGLPGAVSKYGLYRTGKDDVRRERLREPDKTRYEIYDAIKGCLPKCKNWNELEGKLKEQGIGVRTSIAEIPTANRVFSSRKTASSSPDRRSTGHSALRNSTTGSPTCNSRRCTGPRSSGNLGGGRQYTVRHLPGCNMGMGGGTREEPAAPSPGKAGRFRFRQPSSPVGVSAAQLQRKPRKKEHIARITALLDAAAAAMAIAAMERPTQARRTEKRAKNENITLKPESHERQK